MNKIQGNSPPLSCSYSEIDQLIDLNIPKMEPMRKNAWNLSDLDQNWVRNAATKMSAYQILKRWRNDTDLSLEIAGPPDEIVRQPDQDERLLIRLN